MEKVLKFILKKGGKLLNQNNVQSYWKERAIKFKAEAVGFDCKPKNQQDFNYQLRQDFIMPKIRTSVPTLDYGCGIGRYAKCFESYIGVDITEELIPIAIKNNPTQIFCHLDEPYLDDSIAETIYEVKKPEQVFTATVLQHCDDDLVIKIIHSFNKIPSINNFLFYEKDNRDAKAHVVSRSTIQYRNLINKAGYYVKSMSSRPHIIHNEKHTLSIFKVG